MRREQISASNSTDGEMPGMKAIQFNRTGGPDVLEYVDIDLPPPGAGEAPKPAKGTACCCCCGGGAPKVNAILRRWMK